MFASKSVFQALNNITILNVLEHAYHNFSINLFRGEGGGGNSNIYKGGWRGEGGAKQRNYDIP